MSLNWHLAGAWRCCPQAPGSNTMPLCVLVGGQEVVAPAETAARTNVMQMSEPAQKSRQISARAMAVEANNGKKTCRTGVPLALSHLNAP